MAMVKFKQEPIRLPSKKKRELRTQFGALCYRYRNKKLQVLLITSRKQGRWIIPKGWPVHKATPAETARREAFEEAGVVGKVLPICLGIYSRTHNLQANRLPSIVAVFPLKCSGYLTDFPEAGQRRRKWVTRKKAARLVENPELAQLILAFDPKQLRR